MFQGKNYQLFLCVLTILLLTYSNSYAKKNNKLKKDQLHNIGFIGKKLDDQCEKTNLEDKTNKNCKKVIGLSFHPDECECLPGLNIFAKGGLNNFPLNISAYVELNKIFHSSIFSDITFNVTKPFSDKNYMFDLSLSKKRHGNIEVSSFPSGRFSILHSPIEEMEKIVLISGIIVPFISKYLQFYFSFGLNFDSVYNYLNNKNLFRKNNYEYNWFGFDSIFNKLNNEERPTEGIKYGMQSKFGSFHNVQNANFVKLSIFGEKYIPLNKDHSIVLSLKGQAGIVESSFSKKNMIPSNELFYAGGIFNNTIRVFNWGFAGPYCVNNKLLIDSVERFMQDEILRFPVGGTKAFFVSSELIFPIIPKFISKNLNKKVKGYFFYDGGSAWDTQTIDPYKTDPGYSIENNSFKYHHSYGAGLKIINASKNVVFKLEYGVPIDKYNCARDLFKSRIAGGLTIKF